MFKVSYDYFLTQILTIMKFSKFLIGLVALSLTSCASEPILNLQESAPLQNEEGTKVSLDKALSRAEEFFAEIEGETRAAQRVVSSVEIIKNNNVAKRKCIFL